MGVLNMLRPRTLVSLMIWLLLTAYDDLAGECNTINFGQLAPKS